ncbi:hypothetical protein ABVK25_002454 [Lepraria finkii]|uniref:Uncharacterized protein n=1 Tax=Lepraria finkii TaxID=1340010 RepID=A0ABR4BHU2_9LECA
MDPAIVSGLIVAEQVVSATVETRAVVTYGLGYNPHNPSPQPSFERTTLSQESEPGKLAGDEIHIVSLPLKKA